DLSRRAEAELRYRELMGVVDKGIVVRGSGGEIVYANAAAIRMLNVESGLSMDEEMQPGRWKIIDENGRELERDELPAMRALRTGAIVDNTVLGDYNLRLRKLTWLAVTAVPQFAPDADIPHQVLSLFTVGTELKRDADLFDRVHALAHIGGWQRDAARARLHLSEEALRILGLHAMPPNLQAVLAVPVPNARLRARAGLERRRASGAGLDLELHAGRGDAPLW